MLTGFFLPSGGRGLFLAWDDVANRERETGSLVEAVATTLGALLARAGRLSVDEHLQYGGISNEHSHHLE